MAGTRDVGDIRATEVAAALAGQHSALHQLAHHLLGEERVPGGPLGDDPRQLADRGIRPEQLTQQRRGVRITQWGKRYRLRTVHPRQRSLILGAEGDQHHRRGARNDGEEVGQHRLADRIDPVRILDDEQRRLGARQRCRVHQRGQPAPPRIRIDLGQRHIGVGDAEQIIQQQQILRVGIGHIRPQPGAGGFAVEVGHTAARPQQPRHHVEGNVTGVGFAEGPKHLDPATGGQRRGLPGHPGLADARRSHHVHHTTAATDRALHHGVERRHLPAPTHQGRLGAPELAVARADPHQPARAHRFVGPLDADPLRFTQYGGVLDQPRRRLREHHPARGRHRFHPLRKPDRLADRSVTHCPRADLTGDHPTRIQAHP